MTQQHYRIVALPGRGMESEILGASLRVLQAIAAAEKFTVTVDYSADDSGADDPGADGCGAGENCSEVAGSGKGKAEVFEETLQLCRECSGIVCTRLEPDMRRAICQHFDLFVDLYSARSSPRSTVASPLKPDRLSGVDLLFVREMRSRTTSGKSGRGVDNKGTFGFQTIRLEDAEVRRIARLALESARDRRQHLTIAHQDQLLTRLPWTRLIQAEAEAFPMVASELIHVDYLAMQIMLRPQHFDVILTCHLFGGITNNLSRAIVGSDELIGCAHVGSEQFGLYEMPHGVEDAADPGTAVLSLLSSMSLMLIQWGEGQAAQRLKSAQSRFLVQAQATCSLDELVTGLTQAIESTQ
ncbi:MAG: isocitrate/isopropylmalate family dehydrogenase [Elainellaceae cyanobacterium]